MCSVKEVRDPETKRVVAYTLKNGGAGITEPFISGDYEIMDNGRRQAFITELLSKTGVDIKDVKEWHLRTYIEPDIVYVTDHAMERLRKRLGWNKKTALRMVARVYDCGVTKDGTTGTLNKWIVQKENADINKDMNITFKLYGQYVFLFDGQILVTAYNISQKGSFVEVLKKKKRYNRAAFKRGECFA